ncbi:hypothetical protein JCM6882_003236 [Rhodosporidiobolus microsporus]
MATSVHSDPLPAPVLPSPPQTSSLAPGDTSPAGPLTGPHKDDVKAREKGKKKDEGWIDLKGFAAGTASGVTKLVVGHPFDVIKVRLQCSVPGTYAGPMDALKQTVRREGALALYKGATPPLIGWTISDSMMGSLHQYRVIIAKWESGMRSGWRDEGAAVGKDGKPEGLGLSLGGHFLSGFLAGQTVCFVAAPTEHLKARLQMQTVGPKLYSGPLDCAKKVVEARGVKGLWTGLGGTMLFRGWMGVMFLTYELNLRFLRRFAPDMNKGTANFLAGGMASNAFWISAFPFDAVKNRIMIQDLHNPKYRTWRECARGIYLEGGVKAFYRGFLPGILRAFPTNASALFVWEGVMRWMGTTEIVEKVD